MLPYIRPRGHSRRGHGRGRRRGEHAQAYGRIRQPTEHMTMPTRALLLSELLSESMGRDCYERKFRNLSELQHKWQSLKCGMTLWIRAELLSGENTTAGDLPKIAKIDAVILAIERLSRKLWTPAMKITFINLIAVFSELERLPQAASAPRPEAANN